MMIYIDAEQLQDGLYNIKDGQIFKYKANGGTARVYKLENRPQGEWKHESDCGITKCKKCGWSIEECIDWNYCPNCGARMKGADDE
jgi:rubrerythrin